jgi:hypothetical protein
MNYTRLEQPRESLKAQERGRNKIKSGDLVRKGDNLKCGAAGKSAASVEPQPRFPLSCHWFPVKIIKIITELLCFCRSFFLSGKKTRSCHELT